MMTPPKNKQSRYLLPLSLSLILLIAPAFAYNLSNNQSADIVIGQANFVSTNDNQGGSPAAYTLSRPCSVDSDGTKLFISENQNHRILIYNSIPTSNNAPADVVIGQANFVSNSANQGGANPTARTFNTPKAAYYDGRRLVVADCYNHRILIYNSIPTSNNAAADIVLGQPGFVTGAIYATDANTFYQPMDVYSNGTKLIVADRVNNRILIFNSIPTSNNVPADVVIGQVDFTHGSINQDGGAVPGANTLNHPRSIYCDGTRLVITDANNHRVLIYNSIPTSSNASADVVIGQVDFVHGLANQGLANPTAYTLNEPKGAYSDGRRLFIADSKNSRVLVYNSIPTSNNAPADIVIGQANFVSGSPDQGGSAGANTLDEPTSIYSDGTRFFVTDTKNSRVLGYNIATCNSAKVTKTANKETAQVGDIITYKISITNNEGALLQGIKVADTIPAGFRYVKGSAFKNNTSIAEPEARGRRYTFNLEDISATRVTTLTYQLLVTGAVHPGRRYVNVARVTDSTGHLNISARIEKPIRIIRGPLLDTVIGKVFTDKNSNGFQDSGEEGLANVKIYTEDGIIITTDSYGRYHLPTTYPNNNGKLYKTKLLKLDTRTLPEGYQLTTPQTQIADLTDQLLTKINFGARPAAEEQAEVRSVSSQASPAGPAAQPAKPASSAKKDTDLFEDLMSKLKSKLKIEKLDSILVGLVDVELSPRSVKGNTEAVEGVEWYKDGFFTDARGAYFIDLKINDRYRFLSSLDTDRHNENFYLRNLDPDRYYPTYGDESSIDYTANNTQGKLFAQLMWDDSNIYWGNYHTNLTSTELARYNRSLYGLKIDYKDINKTRYKDPKLEALFFSSRAIKLASHDEFLGTGTSLYYLSHKDLTEGGEKLSVEVRDKDSSMVLERIYLKEESDYTIDYELGVIHLTLPLSQIALNNSIISSDLLNGNPIYLIADYEYEPSELSDESMQGVRLRKSLGDHLYLGFTRLEQTQAAENYQLTGVDLTLKAKEKTNLTFEFASTQTEQINSFLSLNGGFTFSSLSTANAEEGQAKSVKFQTELGEWLDREGNFLSIDGYYKDISPGFSTADTVQAQGSLAYGAKLGTSLSPKDRLSLDYGVQELENTSIQNAIDSTESPLDNNSRAHHYQKTGLQYTHTEEKWDVTTEVKDERRKSPLGTIRDTNTNTAALRLGYNLTKALRVFLGQQLTFAGDNNDQTFFGTSCKVSDDTMLHLEERLGRSGDSTMVTVEKSISDAASYYVRYGLGSEDSLTVGQRGKIDENTNIYFEDQYVHDSILQEGSTYNRVAGLSRKFTNGWQADLAYSRSSLEDESLISRDAGSLALSYLDKGKLEFFTKAEYRKDKGSQHYSQGTTYNKLKYHFSPAITILLELDFSITKNTTADNTNSLYQRNAFGIAFRPVTWDKLNMFFKYTDLVGQRPLSLTSDARDRSRRDICSIEATYDLTKRIELVEEFAFRKVWTATAPQDRTSSDTYLMISRLNYRLNRLWMVALEARALTQKIAKNQKVGYLCEIGRYITDNLRLSAGYDFSQFTDDLTSDSDYRSAGPYVRIVAKY